MTCSWDISVVLMNDPGHYPSNVSFSDDLFLDDLFFVCVHPRHWFRNAGVQPFFVPSLAPTRLLRLVEQKTECKAVELVHEVLDLRLLEQLHVQGNDLADDVAQALVASGGCRVYVVGGLGELGVVPEDDAGLLVLLDAELLQSGDVVLVRRLVHLGVSDHVLGGAIKVTRGCFCFTLTTDKVCTV